MAAREDEAQAVVLVGGRVRGQGAQDLVAGIVGVAVGHVGELLDARVGGARPPQAVERAPPRGDGQPGPDVARDAVARPGRGRVDVGVLEGVLGELEVAEVADERGEDPRPLVAAGAGEGLVRPLRRGRRRPGGAAGRAGAHPWSNSMMGRTSTEP